MIDIERIKEYVDRKIRYECIPCTHEEDCEECDAFRAFCCKGNKDERNSAVEYAKDALKDVLKEIERLEYNEAAKQNPIRSILLSAGYGLKHPLDK